MPRAKKVTATFIVTAFRDVEEGPPEIHGRLADVAGDLDVDIGRHYAVELVPVAETDESDDDDELIE